MSDEQHQPGWVPRDPSSPASPAATGGPARPGEPRKPGKGGKKPRPRRTGLRRLLPTWRMILGTIVLLALLIGGGLVFGYLLIPIPPANAAATAQNNVYLYADGSPLARDGEVNRQNVRLAEVPRPVQRAVLSAEDRDFYSERAVDPQAMIRAAWNTLTGKGKQSGSTITQQYVKNYYLGQEQTVTRKAKEFFIAVKLGREESKNSILEGYLNTSYFGRNAYGIQAASHAYYGKDAVNLSTAEGAYLAALLNAPSAYDVVTHPQNRAKAVNRWNYVLDGMVKEKWLAPADRAAMKFPVPRTAKAASGMSGQRGYLVEAIEDYLTTHDIIDEKTLAAGGYRITTTIDKQRQNAFVDAVNEELVSSIDKGSKKDRIVRAGGASIDPKTGNVVAMYGGFDYTRQYVNNATRRDYQVGSTFKPFVLTSAVENSSSTQDGRRITPNTVYDGTNKRPVLGPDGPVDYAPANEDDISYGPITVRTATDKSVNAVYAQMAVDVGPARVEQTAVDLGIPEDTPAMDAVPSIALGTAQASVLDMTQAYATLAGHGEHLDYTLVEKITKDGAEVELPMRGTTQVISREAADTTTSVLQGVVENGTGTAALAADRPAAGKTGTAEEDRAAWFAGYTPDLATVVAVMGQDPDTGKLLPLYGTLGEARINGGGFPARIWAEYTKSALEDSEPVDFDLELQEGADYRIPEDPETREPDERETPDPDQDGRTHGGPWTGGTTDTGGTTGASQTPGGPAQGGQSEGGQSQGGTTDGGTTDAGGTTDGGTADGGGTDGGAADGGTADGGTADGGTTDGGPTDAGAATGPPSTQATRPRNR